MENASPNLRAGKGAKPEIRMRDERAEVRSGVIRLGRDDFERDTPRVHRRAPVQRQLLPVNPAQNVEHSVPQNLRKGAARFAAHPFQLDQPRGRVGVRPVDEIDGASSLLVGTENPGRGRALVVIPRHAPPPRHHDEGSFENDFRRRVVRAYVRLLSKRPKFPRHGGWGPAILRFQTVAHRIHVYSHALLLSCFPGVKSTPASRTVIGRCGNVKLLPLTSAPSTGRGGAPASACRGRRGRRSGR